MAASAKKKSGKGLGRGLDALLGDAPAPRAEAPASAAGPKTELPIEFLKPNGDQPRRIFDEAGIEELALSIKARGVLQPILVRPKGKDRYEIVAGEQRWRAAQKAKLHSVPVIIRELTEEETAEIALIENVQRVDLSPIEEAAAYQRLADNYKRTQEQIAKAVGKSRPHVANIMRLLKLPQMAKDALARGDLSMGHARALLGSKDPVRLCKEVLAKGLSVRQTELLARGDANNITKTEGSAHSSGDKPGQKKPAAKDADTRALERDLSSILGLDVAIDHSKKGAGSIKIDYMTLDQLDDLCRRLMGVSV